MRKIYKIVVLILVMVLFVGCELDEDPELNLSFEGNWRVTHVRLDGIDIMSIILHLDAVRIETSFNTDLTYTTRQYDAAGAIIEEQNGTYTLSGSNVTIKPEGDTVGWVWAWAVVDGDTFTMTTNQTSGRYWQEFSRL